MKPHSTSLLLLAFQAGIYASGMENGLMLSSDSPDRFVDVVHYMADCSEKAPDGSMSQVISLEVEMKSDHIEVKNCRKTGGRDYNQPVTSKEKKDLSYIVNTLARNTWTTILGEKSSLNKAGDRIDHLHPLRFLMTIFTDEELKAGINAIKSKGGIIWRNFFGGLRDSLQKESDQNNMLPEYVNDFASVVGIDPELISPLINNQKWKEFVDILIEKIPRSGNPGRYDM